MICDASRLTDKVHRPDKIWVLVQTLEALGVPAQAVLEGSGIKPDALGDATNRVSVQQTLAVHANALRLSPDPAVALHVGTRIHITHFGLYGYALLASTSPRQAIDFAIKYRALASPLIGLDFALDGNEGVWSLSDVLGLDTDSAAFRFLAEMQLGTLLSLHRDLLGTTPQPLRVRLSYRAPAHAACYQDVLGCPVSFEAPANELRLDARWLSHPLAFANPISAALAKKTCDQMLADLHHRTGVVGRLATLLLQRPGRFPRVAAAAAELGMTTRTLHRRLKAEGSTYQQVLDTVRCQLATDYLQRTPMTVEDIAHALGFSDAANFRHAFKRWTGRTAGSYRAL